MKNYKKIVYMIIAVVAFLLFLKDDLTSMQSMNAIIPEIVFEGEYKVGDGVWRVYRKGGHIPTTKGDVVLKGELKLYYKGEELGNVMPGTDIAFYGNHVAVEIIEGDLKTNMGPEIEQIYPSSCERNWCVYTYVGESSGEIQLHVKNNHKYGNEKAVDELLNSLEIYVPTSFDENKIKESALPFGMGLIVLICVFGLTGVYIFARITHVKQSNRFLQMACFMLLGGLCIIFGDKNVVLIIDKYTFNTIALGICRMLYMLCACEMLCSYMNEELQCKINKLLNVMRGIVILIVSIPIVTNVLFYDLLFYWGVGQALICVAIFGLIVNEIVSEGKVEHWSMAHVAGVCVAFVVDFVAVHTGVWNASNASAIMFFILVLRGFIVLMYTVPKNINAAERAQKLEQELNDSRIAIMMSQIRTHFIFNVMNAISGLCSIDPKKADESLIQFARYLRRNTSIMEEDNPISFSKELQHLEDYVSLEKLRFGERVSFETEIETSDFELPPLTIQPLVENAIKHGFIEVGKSGKVVLKTRETNEEIQVIIEDNGVGFEAEELEKETSVGVRNVRYRLERMVNGRLEITSTPGEGAQVMIHLPKRKRV